MIKCRTLLNTTVFLVLSGLSGCYGNAPNAGSAVAETMDADAEVQLTDRHSYELRAIDQLLGKYHLKRYKLDDVFSEKIWDSYIEQLDPGRVYFTQADIDSFVRHKHAFDDYIEDGDTAPALEIFKIYRQRVQERSDFAARRVEEPFDFSVREYYRVDRSEVPWAKNKAELDNIWRKRIKNDLLAIKLSDDKEAIDEAVSTLKKRYQNIAKRTSQLKQNDVFQIIANSFAGALEPHTSYFSPRASEEFNIQMRLSLDGIGAVLRTEKEHTKIVSIVPGGPADKTGKLKSGDLIIAIAQGEGTPPQDVVGWRLSDVVNLIRGKKGTTVEITYLPGESGLSGSKRKVAIVRDKIKLEHQAASKRVIDVNTEVGKSRIGVIDLPSFYIDFEARAQGDKNYRSTTRDVEKLLLELKEKDKVDGVVIDLRGNGGGSLSEVVTLTGLFIDQGPVVQVQDTTSQTLQQEDEIPGVVYDGPLAVMVDKGSASASEIFAGAIKDYKRGIVIGETTFGKGTVQTILPIGTSMFSAFKREKLGQVRCTTAQFFRVNGDSTQYKGVIPDIKWPVPELDGEEFGERSLKNAIKWKQVDKANYRLYKGAVHDSVLEQEKKISVRRMKSDAKFQAWLERRNLLVNQGKEELLPLNMTERKSKNDLFNERLLAAENKMRVADKLKPYSSIRELQKDQEARNDDIFNKDKQPVDVFLKETANILNDIRYLSSESLSKVLQEEVSQIHKAR